MKIIVNAHNIEIEKEEKINAGEYNIQECTFEFSEEYTNLVKVAIFSSQTNSYRVNIDNSNKCIIPYEVLENENIITIGVYGYEVDGEKLIKRYSPTPKHFQVEDGSYKLGDDINPPSPSIIEQLQQEVEELSNTVSTFEEEQETQNTNISNLQEFKVDKIIGKGLSTNDYTNEEKQKLSNLENYDDTEVKQDISNIKQEQITQNTNIQTNASNISDLQTNKADKSEIPIVPSNVSAFNNDAGYITNAVNNLTNYILKTSTGSLIDLEVNSSTYVVTLRLKDIDGNVISTDTIDLPLESVVVSGSFDSANKKIVLTLQNGNTVDIPVGDLVAGLQTEITSTNKLNADYVDDTNSGKKLVNPSEKTTWNAKYDKPSGGIPDTDLSSAVQTSLDKADSAVQNTDYATSSKGGVLKSGSNDFNVNENGIPFLSTRTYSSYTSAGTYLFISKGTLENVITGKQLVNQTYVDGLVGDIGTALDLINGEVVD